MKVIIDGIEDMVSPEGEATSGEFLKNLRDWLKSQNRELLTIAADSAAVDPKEYAAFAARPIDQVALLEISTVDCTRKLVDILSGVNSHIPALTSSLGEVARLIHQGSHEKAFQLFSVSLEMLHAINDAFARVAELMELEFSEVKVGDESILEKTKALTAIIASALEAFQKQDYVGLADVLEYELLPHIPEFDQAVRKLSSIALAKMPRP